MLEGYALHPNQFGYAVYGDRGVANRLDELTGKRAEGVLAIVADDARKSELFRMGKEYVTAQYDRIRALGNKRSRFYTGTLKHIENIEFISYHALCLYNSDFGLKNRKRVVTGFEGLPINLKKLFFDLGLKGLMNHPLAGDPVDSPRIVVKAFDAVYQREKSARSLFDSNCKPYIKFIDRSIAVVR